MRLSVIKFRNFPKPKFRRIEREYVNFISICCISLNSNGFFAFFDLNLYFSRISRFCWIVQVTGGGCSPRIHFRTEVRLKSRHDRFSFNGGNLSVSLVSALTNIQFFKQLGFGFHRFFQYFSFFPTRFGGGYKVTRIRLFFSRLKI